MAQQDDGRILETGPWGSGSNNNQDGNNNPWGQRPGKGGGPGGQEPPDLDDVLRQAQNRFKNTFGGGMPAGTPSPRKTLFAALGLLLVLWLATGFYRVLPEEDAVIMTFGKWSSTRDEAGLGYHIPYPVQQVIKVNVAFDRRIEIGFRDHSTGPRAAANDIPGESLMLTGDENIIDIDFILLWRIADAGKYLFEIRDPEQTIKKVAESAMREIIGRTEIQKALTESRGEIAVKTKELMQKMLDEYNSGIAVNSVQLLRVDPPTQVVDAFDDVQRARTDKERLKNEAETYRNDIVPKARGEAQKMLQDAEAYKEAVTSKAKGDAGRFISIYNAYVQAKDVTQRRIYLETMQQILQNSKKIIVGDDKGVPVLPYMQLEQPKAAAHTRAAAPPQP